MKKQNLADFFPSKKLEEVDKILCSYLEAIKISKEDERVKYILNDPYCPDMSVIRGVYIIYKKSILDLLEGSISSIHSYEFTRANKQEQINYEEDIEYLLKMASVVALASENNETLSTYFVATSTGKLDSIFNLCVGYTKDLEDKKFTASLQRFMKDIKIVEQMGLLEAITDNH